MTSIYDSHWTDVLSDDEYRKYLEHRAYADYGPQTDHTDTIYSLIDLDGIPSDDDVLAVVVTGPEYEYDVFSCENYPDPH